MTALDDELFLEAGSPPRCTGEFVLAVAVLGSAVAALTVSLGLGAAVRVARQLARGAR